MATASFPEPLLLRLQGLLEFWFSDANLSRDKFLSGKVAGGGADGWVSLCTVAAFKKVLVVLAAPRTPHLARATSPMPPVFLYTPLSCVIES